MHAAADAPNLASTMNIGAFNLGNAIGGGVIAMGLRLPALALAGAVMAGLRLAAVLLANRAPTRPNAALCNEAA